MRRRQDQVAFTRSTVGFEGELHAIRLLLIDEDPVSGQKIMGKTGSGEVLEIFPKTKNRIHCVTDTKVTSAVFRADIERIASLVGYDLSDISHSNIFEFVTLPTDDLRELKDQFNEIVRIEKDLIHYILKQKKDKPRLELICVKSWIDDYNDRYPDSPLPPSQDSSRMYILLKYSCKELIKEAQEKEDEQKNEISERADFIQNKLMHYVQYNFVMALDTKMGSQLIQVFEANSHISENLNKIKELKEQKESVRELCRS